MYFPSLPALRNTCSRDTEYLCDSVSVVVVSSKWKAVIRGVQRSAVCLHRVEYRGIDNTICGFSLSILTSGGTAQHLSYSLKVINGMRGAKPCQDKNFL